MFTLSFQRAIAIAASGVVAAAVIVGLFLAGSPGNERLRRLDDQRLGDLQQLSAAIDQFWNLERRLPTNLDELKNHRAIFLSSIMDPGTQQTYEYQQTSTTSYRLCAIFQTAINSQDVFANQPIYRNGQGFWRHTSGHVCYAISINPTLLKEIPNQPIVQPRPLTPPPQP